MYIVRFIRRDKKPDENYYYHEVNDAFHHMSLFKKDTSGLYKAIEIVFCNEFGTENILCSLLFSKYLNA